MSRRRDNSRYSGMTEMMKRIAVIVAKKRRVRRGIAAPINRLHRRRHMRFGRWTNHRAVGSGTAMESGPKNAQSRIKDPRRFHHDEVSDVGDALDADERRNAAGTLKTARGGSVPPHDQADGGFERGHRRVLGVSPPSRPV